MAVRAQTRPAGRLNGVIALPFGPVGIVAADGVVRELRFLPPGTALQDPDNDTAGAVAHALRAWFDQPDTMAAPFPVALARCGTPFQQRVWAAISAIPRGSRLSYGELACRLGSSARAVGQACGANPFPLVVPCHRVTARHGTGGFAHASGGWLLAIKHWLLAFEASPAAPPASDRASRR